MYDGIRPQDSWRKKVDRIRGSWWRKKEGRDNREGEDE